jgi:hypothetical protein
VLEHEPYALRHIYIDTGCGILTRAQIEEKGADGRPKRRPFSEEKDNGGRHPLLDTVLNLVGSPIFREPIVIQGSAGSGKSSFTLQLAAAALLFATSLDPEASKTAIEAGAIDYAALQDERRRRAARADSQDEVSQSQSPESD